MKNKNIFSIILVSVFVFLCLFLINNNFSKKLEVSNIKYVKISDVFVKVDLALTREEQERGLSVKKYMKDDEGMLFVFKKSAKYNFWMKDMSFPIDIIWINDKMRVVYIEKNVKADTYPQTFGSNQEARYVLEVNAGFSEKNNLKENDFVVFLF
jgi:uncharacterized membrane protein (UPF0127 family)